MSDISLNQQTDDLLLVRGDLILSTGREAIRQHLQQRLRSFTGEWFLDLASGLPYYQSILTKNPELQVVQGILIAEIIGTPGVLELEDFQLDFNPAERRLTCRFTANTSEGVIDFETELEAA